MEKLDDEEDKDEANVNLRNVFIKRGKTIGSGGFSKVYEIEIYPVTPGLDLTALVALGHIPSVGMRRGALKYVIPSPNSGLESLMELHIMRHIPHFTLNRALGVQIDRLGNISIIQNLAIGDAASLVRKSMHRLSPKDLKRWLWEIVCGVAQLHKHGILHGDIKAGNVLLYYDSDFSPPIPPVTKTPYCEEFSQVDVKLNDFSLSRLISNSEAGTRDMPRHITYTSTHRPIEVWKSSSYSFSADIWALGCTFYELGYGMLLFPDQSAVHRSQEAEANFRVFESWALAEITPTSVAEPEIPLRITDHHLHKLDNPEISVPILIPGRGDLPRESKPRVVAFSAPAVSTSIRTPAFRKYNLSKDWTNPQNTLLNDLILGMLDINPSKRYTIWDILDHEYFAEMREDRVYGSLAPPFEERGFANIEYPSDTIATSLIEEARRLVVDNEVIQLAVSLLQRSREMVCDIPLPRLQSCIIAAHKILYRSPPLSFGTVGSTYLQDEINLTLRLGHKLLPHSRS